MQDNELRKLGKTDLLTIIYEQEKKIKQLSEEVEELEKKLEDRTIQIEEAGSIAEASLKLNKIFETAQKAADEYLKSIKEVNNQKIEGNAKVNVVANDESDENTYEEKNEEINTKECEELILINNELMVIRPKLLKRILIFLLHLKDKFNTYSLKIEKERNAKKQRAELKKKVNTVKAKLRKEDLKNKFKQKIESAKYKLKGSAILIKRFFEGVKKSLSELKVKRLNENNEIENKKLEEKNLKKVETKEEKEKRIAKEKAKKAKEKAKKAKLKEKEKIKKAKEKEKEKAKKAKLKEKEKKAKEKQKAKEKAQKEKEKLAKAKEAEKAKEQKAKENEKIEKNENLEKSQINETKVEEKNKLEVDKKINRLKRILIIKIKKASRKTKKFFSSAKEELKFIKKNSIKSEIKSNIERKKKEKSFKISKQEAKLKEMKLSVKEIEAELERQKQLESKAKFVRTFTFSAVVIIAIAIIISTTFFKILQISGNSMEPNLYENELVLTSKFFGYEKGDMIAFYYNDSVLIKRVIALEGDTVSMDEDGTVYVNSVKLEEDYVKELDYGNCDITFPYQVPKDCVFVLGDNRAESLDSRSKSIGSISEDKIIGKIKLKLFPFVIY